MNRSEFSRSAFLQDPARVLVRNLSEAEIPAVVRYWYDSPRDFLKQMGVDPKKLGQRVDFEKGLREKCKGRETQLNVLAILYDEEPVGFHTLNPFIAGSYGIFHAHIWLPHMRGKGIAPISYVKACQIFMARFALQRILFKTPAQNISSIRVKEKLGIRYIGEEIVNFGIVQEGTLAKVFELTKDELNTLTSKMNSKEIDFSQLERNLSLTPEHRLLEHENSLNLVLELQRAGQILNEKPQ